ncbi:MAG: hypothetical protein RL707_1337 [Pseudomonadota bacterium]
MQRAAALLFCMAVVATAHAGNQREEPLIDSVRTALSASVNQLGPPTLVHADVKAANAFQQWLTQTEARLEKQLQRRKASPEPTNLAIAAATVRGIFFPSSHRQTGRRAYARMNAVRKGVKISAIVHESSRIQ